MNQEQPLILQMKNIEKRFPGVVALAGVDFDLRPGEVHVLLGENGAGKSTLIKIISGVYALDKGEILIDGKPAKIETPHDAMDYGVATIYQEFSLIPDMSVAENISLGKEPTQRKGLFIDRKKMVSVAREVLGRLDLDLDLLKLVRYLRTGEQQMVEIAKALTIQSRILILDEPTAALTDREIEHLFRIIGQLKRQGVGIIYISHRLEEIDMIGDRVTVFRDGHCIGTRNVDQTDVDKLISMIVGEEIKEKYPKLQVPIGGDLMTVEGLSRPPYFSGISFSLRAGEILGFAGLLGAGQKELIRSIFGIRPFDSGEVRLAGEPVEIRDPADAIRHGLTYLPADRKIEGLMLPLSVKDNITMSALKQFVRGGFLRKTNERQAATGYYDRLQIKAPSIATLVKYLSGGNQQKVVLARSLCSRSQIFIFDEPTRGIDIGAKVEIYQLINELVGQGAGVIVVSAELPELLGVSDRIIVIHEGGILREFSRAEASQERILQTIYRGRAEAVVGKGESGA